MKVRYRLYMVTPAKIFFLIVLFGLSGVSAKATCVDAFDSSRREENLGNLILQTSRLEIKALGPESIKEALAVWSDPKTSQMSGDTVNFEEAALMLGNGKTKLSAAKDFPYINFGVYLSGKIVGVTQIGVGQEHSIYLAGVGHPHQKWVSISYYLVPAAWGKGFATEVTTRLVRFAFETLDVDGIHAETIAENTISQRVLGKTGFKLLDNLTDPNSIHFYLDKEGGA